MLIVRSREYSEAVAGLLVVYGRNVEMSTVGGTPGNPVVGEEIERCRQGV